VYRDDTIKRGRVFGDKKECGTEIKLVRVVFRLRTGRPRNLLGDGTQLLFPSSYLPWLITTSLLTVTRLYSECWLAGAATPVVES